MSCFFGSAMRRKARSQRCDDLAAVVDRQRRLADEGEAAAGRSPAVARRRRPSRPGRCRRRPGPSCPRPPGARRARSSPPRALRGASCATSTCTLVTSGQVASNTRSPRASASSRTARETPCAEKITVAPSGTCVEFVDEDRSAFAQSAHDVLVVDDLVAHVDRCTEVLDRALDDLDRTIDAGAEAARLGEQRLHLRALPRC